MTEQPLHVRVAEALGWADLVEAPPPLPGMEAHWVGHSPTYLGPPRRTITAIDHIARSVTLTVNACTVDRYDTDWSATGPLIERYGIELERNSRTTRWSASMDERSDEDPTYGVIGQGDAPLLAVCNLILALADAGKLPRVETQEQKR